MSSSIKDLIISNLEAIAKDEVAYKKKFYKSAIESLNRLTLEEINERDDFDDIKGIGKKINEKIKTIRSTGKNLERVDKINDEKKDELFDISTVYGIGPKLKAKIKKDFGNIESLEDLKKKDTEHNFLNDKQRIGIEYYDDILKRIPRNEMNGHNNFIEDIIDNYFESEDLDFVITGSYRRGLEDSGDIDILLTTTNKSNITKKFKKFIDKLIEIKYIVENLAYGNNKFMGMVKLPGCKHYRRLDVIISKPKEFPFELLYFTGNASFNKELRSEALIQGYSLNQNNIKKKGTDEIIDEEFKSEEDILKFLNFKYVEPAKRESGVLEKIN